MKETVTITSRNIYNKQAYTVELQKLLMSTMPVKKVFTRQRLGKYFIYNTCMYLLYKLYIHSCYEIR